jgi:uncharacterized integral membrane protein (TIGR00698 family)
MQTFYTKLHGTLFVTALAIPAWFIGKSLPIIGGPVTGMLIGMLAASHRRPEKFEVGIQFTGKKVLQYAIILLGFEMNLFQVLSVGGSSLFIILFTLSAAFITAWIVGRYLNLRGNTSILIGVGTAICGGSAIAATAPVIGASDKEVAYSISTIFLFNVAAVFIFPFTGHLLGMSDAGFGMWAGTAINDTSSVVAAGYSYSSQAGDFATIVKLTRTLMIVPITLALGFYMSRKQHSGGRFSLQAILPGFIGGFLAASIISTAGFIPSSVAKSLSQAGKFAIVMAMTAIGLNTRPAQLIRHGIKPVLLGLACWLAVALASLATQSHLHMW